MNEYPFILLFMFYIGNFFAMNIEHNYLNKGHDAIFLHINPDLYIPVVKRLENHPMVHAVSEDPGVEPFGSVVTIFLKNGIAAQPNLIDRQSFVELIRSYPEKPLSKNAKRKLKNILHAFLLLSNYRNRGHLCGNYLFGFYPMDDWKQCFLPDFADYFAGMENDINCCLKIAKINNPMA